MNASATWAPPGSGRVQITLTRTWRILTHETGATPGARLYLALAPESLAEGYEAVFPLLDSQGLTHRHARSPEVLREAEAHPGWAGKAVVIEAAGSPDELAAQLDALLAGRGLSGAAVLAGARPVGGQSGLVFIRPSVGATGPDDRRQRLARLLGE